MTSRDEEESSVRQVQKRTVAPTEPSNHVFNIQIFFFCLVI